MLNRRGSRPFLVMLIFRRLLVGRDGGVRACKATLTKNKNKESKLCLPNLWFHEKAVMTVLID
jgi:hypothetical protein